MRRRTLAVAAVDDLTPRLRRIRVTSPDLADFASAAPDDHVKLFLPASAGDGGGSVEACMRDYTPRAFDPGRETLTIDFALHEAGPATRWALAARVGDALEIGGPRGSVVVADDFDWYLLIGDETALPAIGRRVEGLRAGVPVITVAVIGTAAEAQAVETRADWRPAWVARDGGARDDATLLRAALAELRFPAGDGYVWIAAEARTARSLRSYMIETRGHPADWVKASGYWLRGEAAVHQAIEG